MDRIDAAGLKVAPVLHAFIAEALPGTGVSQDAFWTGLAAMVAELAPQNAALLARRDEMQRQIDHWHQDHPAKPINAGEYEQFLRGIGYLLPEPAPFSVETENVDPEIATIAGPQLVVPVMNARYALNAANARWGSLYDALYGTDALPETDGAARAGAYNPVRGHRVVARAKQVLDDAAPPRRRQPRRSHRLHRRRRHPAHRPHRRQHPPQRPGRLHRLHRPRRRPHLDRPASPRHPPADPRRPHPPHRQGRRRRSGRPRARIRHHHHPGLRGQRRRGRRPRQGRRLPQLARPDEGRPHRQPRQRRQNRRPPPQTATASSPPPTAARSPCPAAA